jgi:hypothetical protein
MPYTRRDLELAFVVDASGSIYEEETALQRQSYVDALQHRRILHGISAGFLGKIAVAYIEFAADGCTRMSVGWTNISGTNAVAAFGARIEALPYLPCLSGNAVADALQFAIQSMKRNRFEGTRQVIDISSDSPYTLGLTLSEVCARVVADGTTINAMALDRPEMPGLNDYFHRYVIGGPGAYYMEVKDHSSFTSAILKKPFMKIATAPKTFIEALR